MIGDPRGADDVGGEQNTDIPFCDVILQPGLGDDRTTTKGATVDYLFVTPPGGGDAQMFQGDAGEVERVKTGFEALGYTCTVLVEDERRTYAHLTATLIEQHPELA